SLMVVAGVLALWIALLDIDPGRVGSGRVLIDENHSDWEWTDVPMDTHTYTEQTTYNYYGLARFLRGYYEVDINREALSKDRLAGVDVLVVKTPTEAYSPEEIACIDGFVEQGGGLFLVGDHTNVYGSSYFLNALAKRFGMEFVYDATYDLQSGGLSLYQPPRMARHAAVAQLPPFLFATSCSLKGAPWTRPVQVGDGLLTLPTDYSKHGFFADEDWSRLFYPFGVFNQTLSVSHGSGRVLAFSDSTVWSNFFMFVPGKPELLLGFIDWLNRRPFVPWLPELALIVAILCLAWAMKRTMRTGFGRALPDLVIPALLTTAAAVPLLGVWIAWTHPLPQEKRDLPEVVFYDRSADFFLPALNLIPDRSPSYLTFFNLVQRVGLFPRVNHDLDQSLSQCELLVLLRRWETLNDEELDKIEQYLLSGGRVLLLSDPKRADVVSPLLERVGMDWIEFAKPLEGEAQEMEEYLENEGDDETKIDPERIPVLLNSVDLKVSASLWETFNMGVSGGDPLVAFPDGTVLIAGKQVGESGKIVVSAAADLFANEKLENNHGDPTPLQLEFYEVEYAILRALLPELTDVEDSTD
ncbi:MAG: GldG family protein, partial [Planctomycetes bacterium]|nr:GldG family protein [Planctomycetota bacterium]